MGENEYFFDAGGYKIPYKVIENRRLKNIRITISGEGMRVSLPDMRYLNEAKNLLDRKASWIKKHYDKAAASKPGIKEYNEGSTLSFLGVDYPVRIIETGGETVKAEFDSKNFIIYIPSGCADRDPEIRRVLKKLYAKAAGDIINSRLSYYSKIMGVIYNDVRIKEQKTRWGSCSSIKNLNFNWKLVMMPQEVMDYVVVHELCHIKYMNHSKDFWRMVKTYLPGFEASRRFLKEKGAAFNI